MYDFLQILMPLVHNSWGDLLHSLEKLSESESMASFTLKNTYFMDRFMGDKDYAERSDLDQVRR